MDQFSGRFPFGNLIPFRGESLRGTLQRRGDHVFLRLDSTEHIEFWLEARISRDDVLRELLGNEQEYGPETE